MIWSVITVFVVPAMVYHDLEPFDAIGIEIKEWDKRVHPKMAMEFRSNLMARIKNNFKVLTNAIEDPFQRTIGEYY